MAEETTKTDDELMHERYQAMASMSSEIQKAEEEMRAYRDFLQLAVDGRLATIEIAPNDGRRGPIKIGKNKNTLQVKIVQMYIDYHQELIDRKRAKLKDLDNGKQRFERDTKASSGTVQPNVGPPRGQDTESAVGA